MLYKSEHIIHSNRAGKFKKKLEEFPVDKQWKNVALQGLVEQKFSARLLSGPGLSPANYIDMFKWLLWTEELQLVDDLRRYDTTSTLKSTLTSTPQLPEEVRYRLAVPGLAERHPSITPADIVCIVDLKSGTEYECVSDIDKENEHVLLKMPKSFQYAQGSRVGVKLKFSRTGMRTSHQAVDSFGLDPNLATVLFPPLPLPSSLSSSSSSNDVYVPTFFNARLDPEQKQAVQCAVQMHRSSPYVIFGPPGTGT